MSPRCKLSIGNERFIQVIEWHGELRVDLREWQHNYPTKKGISLNLVQYKNLLAGLDISINPALTENKDDLFHLGANVFVKAKEDNPCMDIRQYWIPPNQQESVPTKKGLCLRSMEYKALTDQMSEIEKHLPELQNVIPCYMQDDHSNQEGMMRCKMCNPDVYQNWL